MALTGAQKDRTTRLLSIVLRSYILVYFSINFLTRAGFIEEKKKNSTQNSRYPLKDYKQFTREITTMKHYYSESLQNHNNTQSVELKFLEISRNQYRFSAVDPCRPTDSTVRSKNKKNKSFRLPTTRRCVAASTIVIIVRRDRFMTPPRTPVSSKR